MTVGLADTYMVSGVSEAAMSSVSLVDQLNILIFQILSALAVGGAVVSSQYLGRRDVRRAGKCAAQLYSVMMVTTLALMMVVLVCSRPVLRVIFGSIEDDVMAYAQIYFLISAISYPFMGIYNAGAALFRAQGNSRISMKASLVMNVINICGNGLLIYGLHPIGIPGGLENGMFQIGKLCVSSLTSTLGTAAIAANAVANNVASVANIPGNTMSLAAIPVIGHCLGAGDKKQAKYYGGVLTGIGMLGLAVTNLTVFISIGWLAEMFHLSEAATGMCVSVMRWFNVFSIFFWAASFIMPHILRTGGDAKYTMTVSILSMWIFRVVLSYFFVLELHQGLMGVWFGMFTDWVCRSVFFTVRFLSGKWMEHKVI